MDEQRHMVEIRAHCDIINSLEGKALFHQVITYHIDDRGAMLVNMNVKPCDSLRFIGSLPRVGVSLSVDPSYFHVTYCGRGPFENYPDRKVAAQQGIWDSSPSKMGYNYIFPTENGNRCDCKWVAFRDDSGRGFCIADACFSGQGFNFSALLHSQKELYETKHTHQLQVREDGQSPIFVHIDTALMGLGGDVSWRPCVHPEYELSPKSRYEFSLLIIPLEPMSHPWDIINHELIRLVNGGS
jgi:beta-galactosidase